MLQTIGTCRIQNKRENEFQYVGSPWASKTDPNETKQIKQASHPGDPRAKNNVQDVQTHCLQRAVKKSLQKSDNDLPPSIPSRSSRPVYLPILYRKHTLLTRQRAERLSRLPAPSQYRAPSPQDPLSILNRGLLVIRLPPPRVRTPSHPVSLPTPKREHTLPQRPLLKSASCPRPPFNKQPSRQDVQH